MFRQGGGQGRRRGAGLSVRWFGVVKVPFFFDRILLSYLLSVVLVKPAVPAH